MDYVVFTFQGAKFIRVGTIAAEKPEFKKECKKMIFRGLYEPITVVRHSSHYFRSLN